MGKFERLRKFFRDNFLSGLLVVVPAVVSIYVFYHLLRWLYNTIVILPIDNERLAGWLKPFMPEWGLVSAIKLVHVIEFLIALLLVFILTSLVGLVTKVGLIRWLIGVGERMLANIPLLGTIYSALKQLLQAIFSGKGNFSKVVMVEFPKQGIWSIGFLSRRTDASFEKLTNNKRMYNIFIPTTPNPTNGFLIIVPEDKVIELDITIDQAFKFIMSGGMVLPHEDLDDLQIKETKKETED